MFATIAYMVAAIYGAQITPYALVVTAFVDMTVAHAFADWVKSRAVREVDHVPVAVISEEGEQIPDEVKEVGALDADEVEERYG